VTAETTTPAERAREAHRLRPGGSGSNAVVHDRVPADARLDGPQPAGRFAGSRLAPALAVVLAADVPSGTQPEALHLAAGGTFLALEVRDGPGDGGFVLSERLLPLELDGTLRLYLGGRLVGETPVEALGRPTERLAWLAGQVGGLRAGDLVLMGGPDSFEARPGTVEVWGPLGSTLTTSLNEDES
jgi:2-keto-4-pentenoate hydratase